MFHDKGKDNDEVSPTTRAPTVSSKPSSAAVVTSNPSRPPTTSAPTRSPTTPAPTRSPTTPAPTRSPTTPAPTRSPEILDPTFAPSPAPTASPRPTGETVVVSGRVWYDADDDGKRIAAGAGRYTSDAAEAARVESTHGVAGVAVYLCECGTSAFKRKTSSQPRTRHGIVMAANEAGRYEFSLMRGLLPPGSPGDFFVVFESPKDWRITGGDGVVPMHGSPDEKPKCVSDAEDGGGKGADGGGGDDIGVGSRGEDPRVNVGGYIMTEFGGYYARSTECISINTRENVDDIATVDVLVSEQEWPLRTRYASTLALTVSFGSGGGSGERRRLGGDYYWEEPKSEENPSSGQETRRLRNYTLQDNNTISNNAEGVLVVPNPSLAPSSESTASPELTAERTFAFLSYAQGQDMQALLEEYTKPRLEEMMEMKMRLNTTNENTTNENTTNAISWSSSPPLQIQGLSVNSMRLIERKGALSRNGRGRRWRRRDLKGDKEAADVDPEVGEEATGDEQEGEEEQVPDDEREGKEEVDDVEQEDEPPPLAIEIIIDVRGEYNPPPYVDLGAFAEQSINSDVESLKRSLKDRMETGALPPAFADVTGISARRVKVPVPAPPPYVASIDNRGLESWAALSVTFLSTTIAFLLGFMLFRRSFRKPPPKTSKEETGTDGTMGLQGDDRLGSARYESIKAKMRLYQKDQDDKCVKKNMTLGTNGSSQDTSDNTPNQEEFIPPWRQRDGRRGSQQVSELSLEEEYIPPRQQRNRRGESEGIDVPKQSGDEDYVPPWRQRSGRDESEVVHVPEQSGEEDYEPPWRQKKGRGKKKGIDVAKQSGEHRRVERRRGGGGKNPRVHRASSDGKRSDKGAL